VRRSAHGFWLAEAGPVEPCPALGEDLRADVLVIGGGYLGMWTAWELTRGGAAVVLLERDVCGHGPSGRNGGFVSGMWDRFDALVAQFGQADALRLARAAADAVSEVGAWCEAEGVDAWFSAVPHVDVATGPGQEGAWAGAVQACREAGEPEEYVALEADEVAAVCRSPRFGGGARAATGATVQPARLALGLRRRLLEVGVRMFERSPVVRLDDRRGDVRATTASGSVRAASAVLAIGAASAAARPLRRRLAVASSHVVATRPVPDGLEQLGWTGGEAISDCRTMLHYVRTTPDGGVVFGWGGGRVGFGARRAPWLDLDTEVQDRTAGALGRLLPPLRADDAVEAWGGPIDVSPDHLPMFGTLRSVHYGFGFTGNGVGPSRLGGRILASLACDARDELTALPLVERAPRPFPPAPAAFAGGTLFRRAMLRADAADEAGKDPDALTGALASLPRRLGFHLPR
jgi:glycine/D-amino acid oxidase-like deaminating enzyme